ncbi:hypothetical protein CU633_18805 [Bacillus sp. V3-13]|uniref:hypothetical protein n=1 Tax=Bacillus sp. V3-13 TaxID=2053728 RepID=UPI000C7824A2|nr:hypothetical protein [Bacillus sp. V3-13]PLR75821.1 hypothetical protein CU633_18805 [Bacillus sp. V3-13]
MSNRIIEEINSVQQERIQSFYRESDPQQARDKIETAIGMSIEEEPVLQVMASKNGFVFNGAFEKREKHGLLYFRTNKNRIISLPDLADYNVIKMY